MPLIDGVKMACEPCIRGHRSTKCDHGNERVMLPVRRPGRPLSSCPHTPDAKKTCGCVAVTAAIPRRQKCHCESTSGTNAKNDTSGATMTGLGTCNLSAAQNGQTDAIGAAGVGGLLKNPQGLPSPSSSRTSSVASQLLLSDSMKNETAGCCSKSSSSSHHPSSQSSVGSTKFLLKLASAPTSTQCAPAQHASVLSLTKNSSRVQKLVSRLSSQKSPIDASALERMDINQLNILPPLHPSSCSNPLQGQMPMMRSAASESSPFPVPRIFSNTASNSPGSTPLLGSQPFSQQRTSPHIVPPYLTSNAAMVQMPVADMTPTHSLTGAGAAENSHFLGDTPQLPLMPSYSDMVPMIFTYPPTYGSHMNPLELVQWREAYAAAQHQQLPLLRRGPLGQPVDANSEGYTHMCTCGNDCQCLGCAAHPFNATTLRTVRAAVHTQISQPLYPPMHGNASINARYQDSITNNLGSYCGSGGASSSSPHAMASQTQAETSSQHQAHGTLDSHAAQTHTSSNITLGTGGEEQTLPADDFFFVNYTLYGGLCAGDPSACPCGDDCACPDCSMHDPNALTIDPAALHPGDLGVADSTHQSNGQEENGDHNSSDGLGGSEQPLSDVSSHTLVDDYQEMQAESSAYDGDLDLDDDDDDDDLI